MSDYSLYEGAKNTPKVNEMITLAIDEFVNKLRAINKEHPGTGMSDTASREVIASEVSDRVFSDL